MESDLLIRQEEVGAKGDYDVSKRMMEILFWDVMDLNEVVLEPNEVLLKRPAVEGKLHDPKIVGLSNDLKNQYQQAPPLLKFGMISFKLMDYWRAPDSDVCYVCGQDDHPEQFSPYNYIYGLAYGVVIFEERGDGEKAIDKLNGYLVGKNKLRVDWAYPLVPSGSKTFPFISMTPTCRLREKHQIVPTTETMTKRIFKKQPLLRGDGKR
ncbi:hypothetical protein ACQ4PT_022849 [Festuca glaucescens]